MKYTAVIEKSGKRLFSIPAGPADCMGEGTKILVQDGRTRRLTVCPVAQRGRLGRAHALFGDELAELLEELNLALAGWADPSAAEQVKREGRTQS